MMTHFKSKVRFAAVIHEIQESESRKENVSLSDIA